MYIIHIFTHPSYYKYTYYKMTKNINEIISFNNIGIHINYIQYNALLC